MDLSRGVEEEGRLRKPVLVFIVSAISGAVSSAREHNAFTVAGGSLIPPLYLGGVKRRGHLVRGLGTEAMAR